jgi:hypothetical protein
MTDSKFAKKWKQTRKKGKIPYIAESGLIICAATVAGAMTAYFFSGNIHFDMALGLAFGGLVGGSIGGSKRWNSNEEKYKKLISVDSMPN